MSDSQTMFARLRKAISGLLLFAAMAMVVVMVGAPKAAHAQMAVSDAPVLGVLTGQTVDKSLTDVLLESATIAVVNASNYFLSQIAYSAAVELSSGCFGQGPCWDSKSFGQGAKEAWQGALGEAVGSLSEGLLGNKFLCSPSPIFTLTLQLGLLDELKPSAPRCDFNAIVDNWSALAGAIDSGEFAKSLLPIFEPGQSPVAVSIDVLDGLVTIRDEEYRKKAIKAITDAAAGGGFSGVTDFVTERVKSPPAVVQEEFKTMYANRGNKQIDQTNQVNAGSIAGRAVGSVLANAAQTFAQTLVSRMWNKLVNGLLSTEELLTLQPDVILDAESALTKPGALGVQQAFQTRFTTATTRDIGIFDPMLDYISCPGTNAGPNNCVLDGQFANAVRVGDVSPITVEEAIEKGMLHKEWPLISATAGAKDRDPFCYTYGYCESNLKKLRAIRIIPVGWEIAASKSSPQSPVTLGEVVAKFDDCNDDGLPDERHPWCHLIDPNWVLKQPPMQCRAEVNGPTLLSSQTSTRSQTCVDMPSCLAQDDYGNCTGGWGYCTREQNVWRFQGDQCPAYYSSCRTLTMRDGGSESFLMNTVTPGVCNADNVGCTAYSLDADLSQSSADPTDDWDIDGPQRYLNKNAAKCAANDAGCTALIRLGVGRSLNLVQNASFEELADGDGNGSPEHPRYWTPFGDTGGGSGSVSSDGSHATNGDNAMRVRRDLSTAAVLDNTGVCTSSVCTEADGCTCAMAPFGGRNFTCRIPPGETSCSITDRVSQDGMTVRPAITYSVSATFLPLTTGNAVGGKIAVHLFDGNRNTINPTGTLATSTLFVDGTATSGTCVATSTGIALTFIGTKNADAKGMRAVCSFTVDAPIVTATVDLYGTPTSDMYVDDVQFEEGPPTVFHETYGATPAVEYFKLPPTYLGCAGEPTDRQECSNYTAYCRENEVGCQRYTPTNGDPAVPAIVSAQDACPAECSGYDIFKQEETFFDGEKFPVYFIPSTARQCTEAESGCSQFTDTQTEQVAYYSALRLCEALSNDPETVFYSWEGSDTAGYQLKSWNLKKTAAAVPNRLLPSGAIGATSADPSTMSDVSTDVSAPGNAGSAPCTALGTDGLSCASRDSGSGTDATGLCSRADIDAGNFDCREFYDANGNRHYRLLSQTIILSTECREYRITASTEADCQKSNGRWNSDREQCVYSAHTQESTSCSAASNGCRPYKGNAASNVRTPIYEMFEEGIAWGGGTISEDSIVAGGHSLKLTSGSTSTATVSGTSPVGRSYTLTFWARGGGTITPSIRTVLGGGAILPFVAAPQALTASWQQYTLGPVVITNQNWGTAITLAFVRDSGADAFIDNIVLKEVQDSIFVVRDSWKTPASCDATLEGLPSPQEMLGCRPYADQSGRTAYLRSFSALCRDQAVGCTAYSDTQNTIDNPYAESFNAVCEYTDTSGNPAVCTAAAAQNGTCRCNYEPLQYGLGVASKPRALIEDACRVSIGSSSCRFHLDRLDDGSSAAAYPDRVNIPADERIFIVPDDEHRCGANAVGCRETGVPKLEYEAECVLRDNAGAPTSCGSAGGCSCDVNGVSCTVAQGRTTCTAVYDTAQITGWSAPAIKDDPAQYNSSLCLAEAVMCEEFRGNDGVYYFKHPQDSVCVFKEDVSVNGESRSGWFRKSDSGVDVPCNPELLRNGELFDIAKNADPGCDLGSVCTRANGCTCSDDDGNAVCTVANGREKCGYQGWVGECRPEADRCEEFIDPAATSESHPAGEPYYYLMNNKLDLKSCGGTASLEEGCVLFQKSSDPARTFSSNPTYYKSEQQSNGAPISPLNCNVFPRPQECDGQCSRPVPGGTGQEYVDGAVCLVDADCSQYGSEANCVISAGGRTLGGFHPNDANIIIKVRRDRECAAWLQCTTTKSVWDSAAGKWKNVCIGIDACQEQRSVGDTQECGELFDEPKQALSEEVYASRDVSYRGMEFSGYSLPGKYPIQYVERIPNYYFGVLDGFGVEDDAGETHDSGYAQCRGYPETDSPFPTSVASSLDSNGSGQPLEVKPGFTGANICSGSNYCECTYTRIGYGAGGSIERFYGQGTCNGGPNGGGKCTSSADCVPSQGGTCSITTPPTSVCVGGPNAGIDCTGQALVDDPNTPNVVENDVCGKTDGGSCVRQTKITRVVGWEGLCVDPDYSFNLNSNQNSYACNLWFPVEQLAGAPDLNNQQNDAGFQPTQEYLYCSVATGNKTALPRPLDANGFGGSDLQHIVERSNLDEYYRLQSLPLYGLQTLMSTRYSMDQGDAPAYGTVETDANGNLRIKWCPIDTSSADGENQEIRVMPPRTIHKDDVSYLIVKMYAGTGVDSGNIDSGDYTGSTRRDSDDYDGRRPIFLLYEGNDWSAAVEWNGDEGGCAAHGEEVPCTGIYAQDHPGTFENRTQARAVWGTDNTLQYFLVRGKNISEDDTEQLVGNTGVCGDNSPEIYIYPYAVMREACTEVKRTTDLALNPDAAFGAWTDRLIRGYLTPADGYDFDHHNDIAGVLTSQAPFGRIAQTNNIGTNGNSVTFQAAPLVPTNWPLQIWSSEGGSVSGMRIRCDDNNNSNDGCDCKQRDHDGGTDDCTIDFALGYTASGIPFSCVGDCGYDTAAPTVLNDAWDGAGANASTFAAQRISQLFSYVYGTYTWNTNTRNGTYDRATTATQTDFRPSYVVPATAPQVRPVNEATCLGRDGNCLEGQSLGMTVNGFMRENVSATGGRLDAAIDFYAWADKDHMPIREVRIDFGDGTAPLPFPGLYRNRRGCAGIGDGRCSTTSQCDGSEWGRTTESCDNNYFSFIHEYRCDPATRDSLPACSVNGAYPCQRDGACVYRPRVRITDNWGQCNGSCPGGAGNGDVCLNATSDFNAPASQECVNDGSGAWTSYAGELIIAPPQQ